MAHGTRATKKGKRYIILEQAPYLETVTFEPDKPFGVILEAMGRGKGKEVRGYFTPEERPEDFLTVRNRMLEALREWIEKGWIEKEAAMERIAAATPGKVVVVTPVVEKKEEVVKPPVVPSPKVTPPEALTPEALTKKWLPRKKNIALLKRDLDTLRPFYDLGDVDAAIEEYRDIKREDYDTAGEYGDARDEAWDNILDALDALSEEPPL